MGGARILAVMIGLAATAATAAGELSVSRVEAPAALTRGDAAPQALVARATLERGDRLGTGPYGHASVQLAGGGTFVLGADAVLHVGDSLPPDPPGRSTRVDLQLERGAIHVDARKLEASAPADVRLAMRYLKARLYGTDAWAEASAAGDELCLVSGAAEIDTPQGHQRLDEPGECLEWTAAGGTRVAARDVGALTTRLASTAFSDDYAQRYVAAQARQNSRIRPSLAERGAGRSADGSPDTKTDTIVLGASAPATAATASATPRAAGAADADLPGREWRLVLAGSPSRAAAEARMRVLRARGWGAEVVPVERDGTPLYRVLSGHYATRLLASRAQAEAHRHDDLKDAWIVQVPVSGPPSAR